MNLWKIKTKSKYTCNQFSAVYGQTQSITVLLHTSHHLYMYVDGNDIVLFATH